MNVISVHKQVDPPVSTYAFELPADDYVLLVENAVPDQQDLDFGMSGLYFEMRDQRWGAYDVIRRIEKRGRSLELGFSAKIELPQDVEKPMTLNCKVAIGDVDEILEELLVSARNAKLEVLNEGKVL